MVVLHAEIDTTVGWANQKELYELTRVDGRWLINDISVKEEELEDKDPYASET